MKSGWNCLFALLLGAGVLRAQPSPHPADSQILSVVEQISADTLLATITRLTQFHTRHTFSDTTSDSTGIGAAMRWVQMKGESYDGTGRIEWEQFPWVGNFGGNPLIRNNLIARVSGAPEDEARYIIGGHLDSRAANLSDNTGFAPGADDNGSACAVFLEVLRLLPDSLAHNLEAVWFTGEEQGLWGSAAYAQHLSQQSARVDGMIAVDMISHTALPGGAIDSMSLRLYAQGPSESLSRGLQRYLKWVGEAYAGIDSFDMVIYPASDRPGRGSDHLSFSGVGYPALRVIERNEDLAYQHNPNDVPQNLSPTYAQRVARCTFGSLLTLLLAPTRPAAPEVTAIVPGQSYQVHVPDSIDLPTDGRFYLAIRDYTHNYYDTVVDLGAARDYVDLPPTPGAVVAYSISRADSSGRPSPFSSEVIVWVSPAGTSPVPLPSEPQISASPNPFNNEVTFTLEIAQPGHAALDVYDLLGRHVASLLNESRTPGVYRVAWAPRELASGIYLASFSTAAAVHILKVTYIR